MDEDKVLDDINSIIDASEAEITKKHKSDKNLPDEKFYAKMTKDTVTRLNRRFGDFATIKYKGHANPKIVRENRVMPDFATIHLSEYHISTKHHNSKNYETPPTTSNTTGLTNTDIHNTSTGGSTITSQAPTSTHREDSTS